jgi:ParB-like chromosome segregation protein Spo0J
MNHSDTLQADLTATIDWTPTTVRLSALMPADSPRLAGEDAEHVRVLAEIEADLPPIIVHRQTMQVIDGMHRFRAALLRGDDTIDVRFVDGAARDAFLVAVQENVAHGLPLSQADREAAAARIVVSHQEWSDRAIAAVTGLAARKVAQIRRHSAQNAGQPDKRVGRDGRVRPVDPVEGRLRAQEIVTERPTASLREVAREAGVSLGTAHDVRKRVTQGQNPVPAKHRDSGTRAASRPPEKTPVAPAADGWPSIRQKLVKDPTLRYAASGRELLQWLDVHAIGCEEWRRLAAAVPPLWSKAVADLARRHAADWLKFADIVEDRGDVPADRVLSQH